MKIVVIIKAIGLSLLAALVIGVVSGLIISTYKPEHPHQIVPNWAIYSTVSLIAGFIVSLISSLLFFFLNIDKIEYVVVISAFVCIVVILVLEFLA